MSSMTPRFVNSSTCFFAGRFIKNAGGGKCLLCVPYETIGGSAFGAMACLSPNWAAANALAGSAGPYQV
jgi:hypothetical protein